MLLKYLNLQVRIRNERSTWFQKVLPNLDATFVPIRKFGHQIDILQKNKEFLGRTSQSFWVFEKGHKSVVKLVRV